VRAQILSIGDEILGGFITDSNSTFLEQQLALLNIEVDLVTHVGDDRDRIARIIRNALDQSEIVICTGGIGPTDDDLTREAIAQVFGETPEVDEGLLVVIRQFFTGRGLDMPERNKKQAWLIPSAQPLLNPVGTAPGWFVRKGRQVVVAMPGVPREMFRMWTDQVFPRLAALDVNQIVQSTTLKTIGIGESLVNQTLQEQVRRADPIVATYAKDDGVHIRVTSKAETAADASRKRENCLSEIRALIGAYIYGEDEETLAGALLRALDERDLTLAIADAGCGGRFASLLAAHHGASSCFAGAHIYPSGISGAADQLASEIARETNATIGLGIVAVYEPLEQGTFAAVVDVAVAGGRTAFRSFPIRTSYEDIQRRSALFGAETLRNALLNS
jgi:nicotinamide-nucleotide amidase